MTDYVCYCIDLGPGIHDKQLLGVLVGLVYGLDVALVFLAPLLAWANQGLAAAGDRGMGDGV